MKQSQHRCFVVTVSILLSGALSPIANAQVTVPNVFENGKVADADEVNENFKALADGINSLPAGVKGEQGDQGVPGPAGAAGPAGAPGASCTVSECAASATATLSCGDNTSVEVPCVKGYKTVFISSAFYKGNLRGSAATGLEGADAKCQGLANAANLGGTYKAWLADADGNSPATRFKTPQPLPYRLVNGQEIASSFAALTGPLTSATEPRITEAITIDENGQFGLGPIYVWTNVTAFGDSLVGSNGETCDDWIEGGTLQGRVGLYEAQDQEWTDSDVIGCQMPSRLYCFEQ